MRVYDVPADKLIKSTADELKKIDALKMPEWVKFVKSGPHKERRPDNPTEFWYVRCASLLRKLYMHDNMGVNTFRRMYGGRKNRGNRREIHVDAGGSIIRKALIGLEKAGLVEKSKKGRKLTGKGRSLIEKIAKSFREEKKVKKEHKKEEAHGGKTKHSTRRSKKKETA